MLRVIEGKRLGSLFGDICQMADSIAAARVTRDVTVWLNAKTEIVCSGAGIAPDLAPEYVLGTYGIGADRADIQADLVAFQNERASNAMIF